MYSYHMTPVTPLPGVYPRQKKTEIHTKTCVWIFSAVLFIIFTCYLTASGLSGGPWGVCCAVWPLSLWCMDSLVVGRGLSSCSRHSLKPMGSVVVAHRLSFSVAGGILVPQPGIELAFLALQGRSLTTGPPRKSQSTVILKDWKVETVQISISW